MKSILNSKVQKPENAIEDQEQGHELKQKCQKILILTSPVNQAVELRTEIWIYSVPKTSKSLTQYAIEGREREWYSVSYGGWQLENEEEEERKRRGKEGLWLSVGKALI